LGYVNDRMERASLHPAPQGTHQQEQLPVYQGTITILLGRQLRTWSISTGEQPFRREPATTLQYLCRKLEFFRYCSSRTKITRCTKVLCRPQWPRGLRRRSAAVSLLRLWIRIPPGTWMAVCSECCVLPGRSLSDELITRPEESYRLWCVVLCDLETSRMRKPWSTGGSCTRSNIKVFILTIGN
jgi:hypothetical protein